MEQLNRNELEALRILWNRGESKPADIEAQFGWPIDNGTLRSALKVLMDKHLVDRRKDGKAYLYTPAQSPETVLARLTDQLARVFTEGSTAKLIAQLLQSERLGEDELAELQQLAKSEKKKARKRDAGKKKTKG